MKDSFRHLRQIHIAVFFHSQIDSSIECGTDMRQVWNAAKGHVVGDVAVEGQEIVARYSNGRNKHGDHHIRSELIYARDSRNEEEEFEYRFVLSGSLNDHETVIWQFHDHWDIPEGITIAGKTFLYAKAAPPIHLAIVRDELYLKYAIANSKPMLNLEQKWLEFDYSIKKYFYRKISLETPVTLNFTVKWCHQGNGYFHSPELDVQNISTMYNSRTPLIQCGLYGSGYLPEGITTNRIQRLTINKKNES